MRQSIAGKGRRYLENVKIRDLGWRETCNHKDKRFKRNLHCTKSMSVGTCITPNYGWECTEMLTARAFRYKSTAMRD